MDAIAVVLPRPETIELSRLPLTPPAPADVVVEIRWSGISTGTERLLWSGRMPPFPGMGYPLVPGYESVGRVTWAGEESGLEVGEQVFVPGARCFGEVRGLFGGAASRLVVEGARVIRIDERLDEQGALLALAATAWHAVRAEDARPPELVVGHGVLGRLIARIAVAHGASPVVWETQALRMEGAEGYRVVHPDADERRDYRSIYDVSGDASLLDGLIGRLAHGGEVTLAGFYSQPLKFDFPPAFMREARLRIAAEWKPDDLRAAHDHVMAGNLSLAGLVTHRSEAAAAHEAYRTAFEDPACLKMLLDWRNAQ